MSNLTEALRRAYSGIVIGPTPAEGECVIVNQRIVYWSRPEQKPDETALLASYDPLPDAKANRLTLLRAQAAEIILAKWPVWAQNNCSLGIYPEATAAQCADDIAAVIAASNAAEDAVEAATTVAEVEAVTATWPTL